MSAPGRCNVCGNTHHGGRTACWWCLQLARLLARLHARWGDGRDAQVIHRLDPGTRVKAYLDPHDVFLFDEAGDISAAAVREAA